MIRSVTLLAGAGCFVAILTCYSMTRDVKQLENDIHSVNQQIIQEGHEIAELQTEWAYLTRPEKLEALANDEKLGLRLARPQPENILTVAEFRQQYRPLLARALLADSVMRPAYHPRRPLLAETRPATQQQIPATLALSVEDIKGFPRPAMRPAHAPQPLLEMPAEQAPADIGPSEFAAVDAGEGSSASGIPVPQRRPGLALRLADLRLNLARRSP